jgi:hypothetical protein
MLRKMAVIAAAAAVVSMGPSATDVLARGGGGHGGGFGGMRGGALGGGLVGSTLSPGIGIASQGAAMATQQRLAPPSTTPSLQISIPKTSNPVPLSIPSSTGQFLGPAPGYGAAGGSHFQPSQSQLPPDLRRTTGSVSEADKAVDRVLNICRGC